MKKSITAITLLIAILLASLPAMSQYYEPDFSDIKALEGPYAEGENPKYYEGIEAYFEALNEILLLKQYVEKITTNTLITYLDNQLKLDNPNTSDSPTPLSNEKKDNLTGFINVMNAYIKNKLNVDNHNEAYGEADIGLAERNPRGSRSKPIQANDFEENFANAISRHISNEEITPEALITYDDFKVFADAISQYISNEGNTPEILITYIVNQLEPNTDDAERSPIGFINVMNTYIKNKLNEDRTGSVNPDTKGHRLNQGGSIREEFKLAGSIQEDLLPNDFKVFADAMTLYIGNDKITSDALIEHINKLLESEEETEMVIIETNTEAFAKKVIEHMEEELNDRGIDIKDTTIVTLYSDPPYGGKANDFLKQLAEDKGFQHESKKDTEFEWSEFPKQHDNFAFIFVRGWGDMYKDAIEKAVENRYIMSKLIGNEWSNSIDMLKQIGKIADGYKAVTYLDEVNKDVYWKLGVWDAYTSTIQSDKLKDRSAINQACKKLILSEENNPCESSGKNTDAMTKGITTIKKWSDTNYDWEDISG